MFVTIDGPDGTGKTTIAKHLVEKLRQLGYPAVYTFEPTDSALGQRIRAALKNGGADLERLTDLFVQDRREHLEQFIRPCLAQGKLVLCDRYKYSTVCYQHLQGEPVDRLLKLNEGFLSPSLAIILYADDVDVLLSRISGRGMEKDLFETRSTLSKSVEIYKSMSSYYPNERIVYLDAEKPFPEILEDAAQCILEHMP